MKKLAVLLAVVAVAALSVSAFAADGSYVTNPYSDVDENSYYYNDIMYLLDQHIMQGGLNRQGERVFNGKEHITRNEVAASLARLLRDVNEKMLDNNEQAMLKKLVVEFKDELDELGVKVDERFGIWEDRLGGWRMHGTLVLQIVNRSANDAADALGADGDGSLNFDEARIFFERTFGENDEYFFRARLRNDDTEYARFDRFYVDMPFFFDSKFTVGRFSWGWEGDYKISLPETGGWTGDQPLTDWTWDGFGITKEFGLGTFQAVVAHPDKNWAGLRDEDGNNTLRDWMIMARGAFQFTEQFGFDLGAQAFVGDNAEWRIDPEHSSTGNWEGQAFKNLWTIFAGLRFNFNENIGFKGIFYSQKVDAETIDNNQWTDMFEDDNSNHWAVMFDVKQPALKFTSLWLEYGQYKQGFITRGNGVIAYSDLLGELIGNRAAVDTKYYRIGLGQQWTDQWATYLFYYGYDRSDVADCAGSKPKEFGVGIQYKMNDHTTFGLNYINANNDVDTDKYPGIAEHDKDNVVRFRTAITF